VRTRKKLVALALGLAAVAALLAFELRDREPTYKGHPLSYWVQKDPAATTLAFADHYTEAITNIGTNALPLLLKWIAYEPSPFHAKAAHLVKIVPYRWRPRLITQSEELAVGASVAFEVLGPLATNAISTLTMLATNSRNDSLTERSARALVSIGPLALPALMTISTNSQVPGRHYAIYFTMALGTNARPAIPFLIGRLSDPDTKVVSSACMAMSSLRLAPETCVPALTNLLTSPDYVCRYCASAALANFGKQSLPAIPQLQKLSKDTNPLVRAEALDALRRIAPDLLTNAPAQSQ
jgi:hypothetical protein